MSKVPFQLNFSGKIFDLSSPVVMAIINLTPDSFFQGSRVKSEEDLIRRVENAFAHGASMIDVGGYSTRPDAVYVSDNEEIERLGVGLATIRKYFPEAIVSVDTFRANVAEFSIKEFGVQIINDVSGGTLDSKMFDVVAKYQVAYVLMHMKGTPQTMTQLTSYDNMMAEIMEFFQKRVRTLQQMGVKDVILDPGFGFAKTLDQNYELMAKMSYFEELELPILCGISRKTMIYKLLETNALEALNGTTALNMLGLMNGADILRVHDVKEAMETIKIFEKYRENGSNNLK